MVVWWDLIWYTLWLWLTVCHVFLVALIEIDGLPFLNMVDLSMAMLVITRWYNAINSIQNVELEMCYCYWIYHFLAPKDRCVGWMILDMFFSPLVMSKLKMTIYSGFSHWKLWFSIAMLNYQRVPILELGLSWNFHLKASTFLFCLGVGFQKTPLKWKGVIPVGRTYFNRNRMGM